MRGSDSLIVAGNTKGRLFSEMRESASMWHKLFLSFVLHSTACTCEGNMITSFKTAWLPRYRS